MKKVLFLLLALCILFNASGAEAAKARQIANTQESNHHEEHLRLHIGCSSLSGTGNYLKVRIESEMGSRVLGHLEQADVFMLHDIRNGLAKVEVLHSADTSPDSWRGLTGWVDTDYLDCNCSSKSYAGEFAEGEFWKKAYCQYVIENELWWYSNKYALLFVDNDHIPEMEINTRVEASGEQVLTYHDGYVDCLQTGRIGFTYLERENLLCNSAGHMGVYYDDVYTIESGKWVLIAAGDYGDGDSSPADTYWDEVDQEWVCPYYAWNGVEVSREKYKNELNAIYNTANAVQTDVYYTWDEMNAWLMQ